MGNCLNSVSKTQELPRFRNNELLQNSHTGIPNLSQEPNSIQEPLKTSHSIGRSIHAVQPPISSNSLGASNHLLLHPIVVDQLEPSPIQIKEFCAGIRQTNQEQCRQCNESQQSSNHNRNNHKNSSNRNNISKNKSQDKDQSKSNNNNSPRSNSISLSLSNKSKNSINSNQADPQDVCLGQTDSVMIQEEQNENSNTSALKQHSAKIEPTASFLVDAQHDSKLPKTKKNSNEVQFQLVNSQILVSQVEKISKIAVKKQSKKSDYLKHPHQNFEQSVIVVKTREENKKQAQNQHQNIEQSAVIVKTRGEKKNIDQMEHKPQKIEQSAIIVKV